MPQLRQNIITGDWVVIAPERAKRPNDFITADTVKHQAKSQCVFCPDASEYPQRLKKFSSKNVWVIPNKYSAFVENPEECSPRSYRVEDNFYRVRPSVGGHDVVVVRDHDQEITKFSRQIWVELLEVFRKRYRYFDKVCAVDYTMPIYNHGSDAGASIEHPHAQIFASNIIPNIITKEIHHTEKHFEHNGSCVFCDLLKHEKEVGKRVLYENKDFLCFTFYAARFPFEIWILPKKHNSLFEEESRAKYKSLAECLMDIFNRLNRVLNDPPLNFFIHSSPNTIRECDYYHWHLEIAPRIQGYGGYEMGSGNIIDVVSPEAAADFLRGEK